VGWPDHIRYHRPDEALADKNNNPRGLAVNKYLSSGILCASLTALPFCGLIFFFELTQPATIEGTVSSLQATVGERNPAAWTDTLMGRHPVTRFRGVSAELGQGSLPRPETKLVTAGDPKSEDSVTLKPGSEFQYVTDQRHRVAVRIVNREPIVDQATPDNYKLMNVAPASTGKLVTFVWGRWLYRAEVEDRGEESDVAVQKSL
jgi:hypothetical protein